MVVSRARWPLMVHRYAGLAVIGLTLAVAATAPAAAHIAVVVGGQARDRLLPEGTLSATNANGPLAFTALSLSGGTLAALAYTPDPNILVVPPAYEVDLFTEPGTGWSSETVDARLTASNREELDSVAVAGDNVFVGAREVAADGPGAVYVFTKPAGGWSGNLHESARLTASDASAGTELGFSVAASGRNVIAQGACAVYVFSRPAGGWAGVVHESAKLTASDGACLGATAMAGRTVVAGGAGALAGARGAVYLFREPAGGWSGALHQSAVLTASDAAANDQLGMTIAMSGSVVVASSYHGIWRNHSTLYVFTAPKRGWSGRVHQSAERKIDFQDGDLGPDLAMSGRTVAAVADIPDAHVCPCSGILYAFSRPTGRWAGTLAVAPSGTGGGTGYPGEVTLSGATLAVPGENSVDISAIVRPPTVPHVSLAGLGAGHPQLHFNVFAGVGTMPITGLTVSLPRGLRFTADGKLIARGLAISRRAKRSVLDGRLSLKFTPFSGRLAVSINGPAVSESRALTRRIDQTINYNRTRHHKRKLRLQLALLADDSRHNITRILLDATIT